MKCVRTLINTWICPICGVEVIVEKIMSPKEDIDSIDEDFLLACIGEHMVSDHGEYTKEIKMIDNPDIDEDDDRPWLDEE